MSDVLQLPPNMEGLVWAFLVEQPEVTDLVGERIYSRISTGATYPLVRITQIDDEPLTTEPLYVVRYFVQVEGFGGSKSQAWRIAETCRTALDARLAGVHEGYGVVNGVDVGGLQDAPDETFTPAKPRWLFTSTIYAHRLASISAS